MIGEPRPFYSTMGEKEGSPKEIFEDKPKAERAKMPELPTTSRVSTFDEVEIVFNYETALQEAKRCLTCGCAQAGNCKTQELCTEYGVKQERFKGARRNYYVDESHPKILYEGHKCIL